MNSQLERAAHTLKAKPWQQFRRGTGCARCARNWKRRPALDTLEKALGLIKDIELQFHLVRVALENEKPAFAA